MMKKNYALFSALVLSSSLMFAQNVGEDLSIYKAKRIQKEGVPLKSTSINSKAPGDTLFYEDFGTGGPGGSQLPVGWTVQNNAGNSNDWIWSNTAPGGQYSTNAPALASTSGANGYMSLPSDLYNTPAPVGGFVDMDVSFTSPAITIAQPRASVVLQWQHLLRYCCNANTVEYVVEVSTDGINWSAPYDAKAGLGVNNYSTNGQVVSVNVSADLAFQTTAYIRFRVGSSSHYLWMVDDVLLLEGNANNMQLEDYEINFSDTFDFNPIPTMVPQKILAPMSFEYASYNAGGNTQTNVQARAYAIQDSTLAGAPGFGLMWEDSTLIGASVASQQRDTVEISSYVNTVPGYFTSLLVVDSDSNNQDPASAIASYSFEVSDSVLARDRNNFTGTVGPGDYVGGGNDGDRWGVLFNVGNAGATINSLDIYVANNATNDGVQIVPKVWAFKDTTVFQSRFGAVVAESFVPTVIDTSMFDTWVNFDFSLGTQPVFLPAGQYVMGWEQISGATNGLEFVAGEDLSMANISPDVTNFVYVNDAAPTWGWVTPTAGVRANFNLTVGEEELARKLASFEVTPNPNNGQFTVNIDSKIEADYTLNVRNMLGQVVLTDQVSVNNQKTIQMDLSNYEKGVYFVTLENDNERKVKKVVVK
tara:strand:- start:10574 stop:12508 length:1935 start_codon:yes stop_codon:yes gene_type:complete